LSASAEFLGYFKFIRQVEPLFTFTANSSSAITSNLPDIPQRAVRSTR